MSQLVNSLLTIVGVLAMMFWISPLLALVALVTVPLSVVRRGRGSASGRSRTSSQQWSTTGKLNGHIEEMFTGHSLVKVFGRQQESEEVFAEQNDKLYEAGVPGAVHLRAHPAGDDVRRNLNYVLVAVVGGLRVASGALSHRQTCRRSSSTRASSPSR